MQRDDWTPGHLLARLAHLLARTLSSEGRFGSVTGIAPTMT
jgi:hypothetical protein